MKNIEILSSIPQSHYWWRQIANKLENCRANTRDSKFNRCSVHRSHNGFLNEWSCWLIVVCSSKEFAPSSSITLFSPTSISFHVFKLLLTSKSLSRDFTAFFLLFISCKRIQCHYDDGEYSCTSFMHESLMKLHDIKWKTLALEEMRKENSVPCSSNVSACVTFDSSSSHIKGSCKLTMKTAKFSHVWFEVQTEFLN